MLSVPSYYRGSFTVLACHRLQIFLRIAKHLFAFDSVTLAPFDNMQ